MPPRLLTWTLLVALLVVGGWFVWASAEHYLHFRSIGPNFTPAPGLMRRFAWWFVIGVTLLLSAAVVYLALLRRPRPTPRGFDLVAGPDDPTRTGGGA